MNIIVIAGGAGFIGSNLLAKLSESNHMVIVLDNMTRGCVDYAKGAWTGDPSHLRVVRCDCSIVPDVDLAFDEISELGKIKEIWHLAANSDIPAGIADASVDLKDTFHTTYALLSAAKKYRVSNFYFASTSAIYGDLGERVLHEEIGPLLPISNYGAMKLASEALISAAAESYLDRVCIFRFPNVVGIPATHGVIFDFVNKLKINPASLAVLGNGTQQKSYLHASDLVSAMLTVTARNGDPKVNVVNIGPIDEGVTVKWIAEQVVKRVSPSADILYGTGNKGWVGDVPKFNYSTDKLQRYGWKPRLGSDGAITRAIDEIATQLGC